MSISVRLLVVMTLTNDACRDEERTTLRRAATFPARPDLPVQEAEPNSRTNRGSWSHRARELEKVRGGEISGADETCGPTITGFNTCANS
jgi:hypothetical protein